MTNLPNFHRSTFEVKTLQECAITNYTVIGDIAFKGSHNIFFNELPGFLLNLEQSWLRHMRFVSVVVVVLSFFICLK